MGWSVVEFEGLLVVVFLIVVGLVVFVDLLEFFDPGPLVLVLVRLLVLDPLVSQ